MKQLLQLVLVFALSTPTLAQDGFKVFDVVDGFTLNNQPAASILYCAIENSDNCISFTLNQESLSILLNDGLIKNQQRDNPDFEVSATFDGINGFLSSKEVTGASLKLMERDENAKTLSIDYFAQLYRTPDKEFPEGSVIRFDRGNLVVSDDNYSALFQLIQQANSPNDSDFSSLSDCDLAEKIIKDTAPYLEKAVHLTNSKDYQDVANWRTHVFNPAISSIEQRYNTEELATQFKNKPISSEIAREYVLRIKLLVQEVSNYVRNGGDKSRIKEQWQLVRVPAEKYAKKCEPQPTLATSVSSPKKRNAILVKKSKSGICHRPGSSWYGRTKSYTSYDSVDACLKSGGRLPKK